MSANPSGRSLLAPLIKLVVFAVVTIMAISLLGNTIRGNDGRGGTEYRALFADATMTEPGDEVRIAGVPVGRVTKVEVWDRDKALVTFTLSGRDSLPTTTHATLKYRNMVGNRYLALTPEKGPEGPAMNAGDTIPLAQTTPAINLTTLFNGFRPLFTELQPDDVNKLSDSLIKVLQGEGGTVQGLVRDIGQLTNTLADRDQVIGEVIDNLTAVLDTINKRDKQFNDLMINTSGLIDGLATDKTEIGNSIDALAGLASTSENLVSNTRPAVTDSLAALNTVASDLNTHSGDVDRVLHNLPIKTEKLIRIGSFGSWFQFYLCGIDVTTGPGQAPGLNPPIMPVINQPIYTNAAPRCNANPQQGGGSGGS